MGFVDSLYSLLVSHHNRVMGTMLCPVNERVSWEQRLADPKR